MAAPWQALSSPGRRHWQLPQLSARWCHFAGGGTRHCCLSRRKSLADVQSTNHINSRRYKQTTSLSAEDTTPNFNRNVWLQGRGKQLLHLSHGSLTSQALSETDVMPENSKLFTLFDILALTSFIWISTYILYHIGEPLIGARVRARTHTRGSSESQISQLEVW